MSGPARRRRIPPDPNSEKNKLQPKSIDKLSLTTKSSRVRSSNYPLKKRMTRASKKVQAQDENIVPHAAKTVVKKSFKNRAPPAKSPVLRDRTNEVLNLSKTDLSPILALPNQRKSTKKLDVTVPNLDQLTFGTNSGIDKKENTQIIHVSKAVEANSQQPQEKRKLRHVSDEGELGLTVKRVLRTRSAQSITEGNKIIQDASLPKTKKFFKSGNSNNRLTKLVEKQSVKRPGRKQKIVKKNTSDSTISFINATPEKCSVGEKKNLRPRQELKNYCEESKLLEKLSPRKRKSIVIINKLPDPNAKKLPIWKSVKFHESEPKGKDVYEISDEDLSSEEHRPKKKKKITRKPVKRLKKSLQFVKTVKTHKSTQTGKSSKLMKTVIKPTSQEITKKKEETPKQDSQVQPRPKMVSVEVLDNSQKVKLVPTPSKLDPPKEFRPFRVTQVFHRRPTMQNNMSDHSLLSKSMSPIVKVEDNINPATPWRIPAVGSFSCVRNLVQSTPRQNKIILGRPSLGGSLPSKNTINDKPKMNKIDEDKSENDQDVSSKLESVSNSIEIVETNEKLKRKSESIGTISPIQNSFGFDDATEDKENAVPNYQSPQKSPKKNTLIGTPVFEPQPGPSGLQRQQPLHETKILRQTNLNNFLNRDDTPERTEIRTPHGIFADVHSTPITVKPLKKICEPNVQNAFGFDDDNFDVSPIPSENIEPVISPSRGVLQVKGMENKNANQKAIGANPMRLSPKKILKTLQKRNVEKKIRTEKENKVENNKLDMTGEDHKNKKENPNNDRVEKLSSETNISDALDLMDPEIQKDEEADKDESTSLPLFADLEPPTHFVTVS